MDKPIIQVNNISKKYKIGVKQSYYALRDVISGIASSPIQLFKSKKIKTGGLFEDEFWALKDISFDVNPGDVVGIIGANGAGKSTLLKIITQITPPTKGEIILRGRVASLLEVGTGFHPELTGRENIYLNGAVLGMKRWEINQKFTEIVEFAEIEKFLDTPVKRYSSGMYMRLAFAVAAHLEPEILLIDEVLAVGDAEFQKKCLGKMDEVTKKEGRTILFVSHNMGAIQNLCNRCILLDKGEIKRIGNTNSVVGEYLKNSASTSKIALNDRKDREGNDKLRVTNVYFKDKNGKNTPFFKSGEDVQIWIEYKLNDRSIKRFDFSIDVDSFVDQTRLAFISNKIFNFKMTPAQDNMVKVQINKLPLFPGKYQFTLFFVSQSGEILDWIQKAGTFEVEYGDYYQTGQLPQSGHGCLLLDYKIR